MKTDMMPGATSIQNENTKDIFILNYTIPVLSGSGNPAISDDLHRPRRDAPARRFNELKTPLPASQEALVRMPVVPSQFLWFGCELPFIPVSPEPGKG